MVLFAHIVNQQKHQLTMKKEEHQDIDVNLVKNHFLFLWGEL